MRGIVLERPGEFKITDLDVPAHPGPGEALVQVHRVGICGTDLHAFQGNQTFFEYPRILGHELAVEVIAVNQAEDLAMGDRCAVEPYLNCGRCIACRRGKPNCCVALKVLGVHVDGGMSGQITVPVAKLHKSESLASDQLALVETLSVGAHAVRRSALNSDDTVLVIGLGPIGLSVVESARLEGAELAVMDISEQRLDFCRRTTGIDHCLGVDDHADEQLRTLLGDLPTVVFDCTGSPRSMERAFDLVCHGGRLIFVGHYPGEVTFQDPVFHGRELALLGSRNATATDFQRIIGLMEQGEIDVSAWINHRVPAASLIETFPQWLKKESGVIKPLIDWEI